MYMWYVVVFKCTELWDAVIRYQGKEKIGEETTRETAMIGTIKNMALFGKWMPRFARRL